MFNICIWCQAYNSESIRPSTVVSIIQFVSKYSDVITVSSQAMKQTGMSESEISVVTEISSMN
jgi:hypothetical protein